MNFKNQNIQKLISFFIIVGIFIPSLFLFSIPQKASAIWGIADVPADAGTNIVTGVSRSASGAATAGSTGVSAGANTTVAAKSMKDIAKEIGQQLLMAIANKVLQKMTQSTVNWINSGFHGSPLFLQNPQSFFKDVAKSEVRKMVDMFGYDSLRYPFGKSFALGIINGYKQTLANNAAYSLSKVMQDPVYLNNYRNNFNTGGWNGWLINTQFPQNNYPGFQNLAAQELARNLQGTSQTAIEKVKDTLNQGQGFLSPQTCPSNQDYNNGTNEFVKPSFDMAKYEQENPYDTTDCSNKQSLCIANINPNASAEEDRNATIACQTAWEKCTTRYDNTYKDEKEIAINTWGDKNTCPGGLKSTTPGSVAAGAIMKSLGASQDQASYAAMVGNSLSTIFDALLNHFLDKGLDSLASSINPPPVQDTWTYAGQSLDSTDSRSSWASGSDEEVNVYTFKKQIEGADVGICSKIKDSSGESLPDQKDLSLAQCDPGLKTETIEIGICKDLKDETDSTILLADLIDTPKTVCDLLHGNWEKTGTVLGNTPVWDNTGHIAGDIDNTREELALMDNPNYDPNYKNTYPESTPSDPTDQECDPVDKISCPLSNPNNPNNPNFATTPHATPGIVQIVTPTKVLAHNLDLCIPGPDKGWEKRLTDEKQRVTTNISTIEIDSSDSNRLRAKNDVMKELDLAVTSFKDWVNTQMMLSLPSAIIYVDAINGAPDYSQKLKELADAKKIKFRTLLRLKAIDASLAAFSKQPDPSTPVGKADEKKLISIKKQYDALKNDISSPNSIESTRNELNTYKNQLINFKRLYDNPTDPRIPGCLQERQTIGWGAIDPTGYGKESKLGGISEMDMFCVKPINGGYSHGEIIAPYDWMQGRAGGHSTPATPGFTFRNQTGSNGDEGYKGQEKGNVGYEDLPLLNAPFVFGNIVCKDFCKWPDFGVIKFGSLGTVDLLPGISGSINAKKNAGDDQRKNVDISCETLFKSSPADYIKDETLPN